MQNMILNNNMKFCFICPICDQQLLDEEVKFLLGDQISYTTVNKINELETEIQTLFVKNEICFICKKANYPSIKIFDCSCNPPIMICYYCLFKHKFNINSLLEKCIDCGNKSFTKELNKFFEILIRKGLYHEEDFQFQSNNSNLLYNYSPSPHHNRESNSETVLNCQDKRETLTNDPGNLNTSRRLINMHHPAKFSETFLKYGSAILARLKGGWFF